MLRARSYLADGAIGEDQLASDGRFIMPGEENSWHFVLTAGGDDVIACVRYSVHDPATVRFEDLRIARVLQFLNVAHARQLKIAIETDLRLARQGGFQYAELGGWAIAEQYRGTKLALQTLLASYAWGGVLARSCIGSCMATTRHGSASMLRRVGGRPVETVEGIVPPYWDPRYRCDIEVLRFDSRVVDRRYEPVIAELQAELQCRPAIYAGHALELEFQSSLLALSAAVNAGHGLVPKPAESGETITMAKG